MLSGTVIAIVAAVAEKASTSKYHLLLCCTGRELSMDSCTIFVPSPSTRPFFRDAVNLIYDHACKLLSVTLFEQITQNHLSALRADVFVSDKCSCAVTQTACLLIAKSISKDI